MGGGDEGTCLRVWDDGALCVGLVCVYEIGCGRVGR